jgi:hypothetical protein
MQHLPGTLIWLWMSLSWKAYSDVLPALLATTTDTPHLSLVSFSTFTGLFFLQEEQTSAWQPSTKQSIT